jgi:hypothetical protein
MMPSACNEKNQFTIIKNRCDDSYVRKMATSSTRMIGDQNITFIRLGFFLLTIRGLGLRTGNITRVLSILALKNGTDTQTVGLKIRFTCTITKFENSFSDDESEKYSEYFQTKKRRRRRRRKGLSMFSNSKAISFLPLLKVFCTLF